MIFRTRSSVKLKKVDKIGRSRQVCLGKCDIGKHFVHVSSVPRHCVSSEISTAIGDRTETRSA